MTKQVVAQRSFRVPGDGLSADVATFPDDSLSTADIAPPTITAAAPKQAAQAPIVPHWLAQLATSAGSTQSDTQSLKHCQSKTINMSWPNAQPDDLFLSGGFSGTLRAKPTCLRVPKGARELFLLRTRFVFPAAFVVLPGELDFVVGLVFLTTSRAVVFGVNWLGGGACFSVTDTNSAQYDGLNQSHGENSFQ
jgi:hypothetical protein